MSPAEKGDADVVSQGSTVRSSRDGSRITYQSPASFAGSEGSFAPNQGLSTLGPEGWTTRGIMPPVDPNYTGAQADNRVGFQTFSDDLRAGVVVQPDPPLTAGAATRIRNAYLSEIDARSYRLLTPPPLAPLHPFFATAYAPVVAAATDDLSHVVFETSGVELTPDAPVGMPSAYEWVDGTTRLVGILPDGTPAPGGSVPGRGAGGGVFAGIANEQYNKTAISEDGSRIFFTTPGSSSGQGASGEIYVRIDGQATQRVSVSRRSTPDPVGPLPATFERASSDGRVALFSSLEKLTDDSTANDGSVGGIKRDLYRYDIDADRLVDLSAAADAGVGGVLGASDDLSTVYFGTDSSDIWVSRNGSLRRIAEAVALEAGDVDWPSRLFISGKQSEVSDDGDLLVFTSLTPQAGWNTGGRFQLFLYDARTDAVTCLTCAQDGEDAIGDSRLRPVERGALFLRPYLPRNIDGAASRIFFETPQPLVPEDVNGKLDVYRYDVAARRSMLVSTGKGAYDARFGDASADGDTVFFVTRQQVIPDLDQDDLADVYVARVGARPHQSAPRGSVCSDDACQGPLPQPPARKPSGSETFHGSEGVDEPAPPVRATVFHVRRVSGKRLRAISRSGKLRFDVRVSSAGTLRSRATARVAGRGRTIASRTIRVRGGGTVAVTLPLSRAAKRELRRRGRLKIAVTVSFRGGGAAQRFSVVARTAARARAAQASTAAADQEVSR